MRYLGVIAFFLAVFSGVAIVVSPSSDAAVPPLTGVPAPLTQQSDSALASGAVPLDITLTVHRQVSSMLYLWIPFWCGLGLAVLLIIGTMLMGVPRPGAGTKEDPRVSFWRVPLYAAAAWTFGDSWATTIAAIGTVIGTVLTASGSIVEVLPGIELGRFSLLIAVAGGITVAAPLLFGALNYRFTSVDPTTAGVAAIALPPGANPGASLELPAGSVITVAGGARQQAVAVPGTSDVIVNAGRRVSVDQMLTVAVSDIADATKPASAQDVPPGTEFAVPGGAKISILGQATMKLPAKAEIRAPVAEPRSPQRRTVLKYPCQFAIPHTGEVVAAKMRTMLLASCMTVFGIGAELAIIGWVLGYDLVVAPQWVRDCSLAFAFAAAALVLGYGISAIRALADSRDGTGLSSAGGSSFML